MIEIFEKMLLIAVIAIATIAFFAGFLLGVLLGALLGWLAGIPLVISIPAGAIAGVVLAETLAFRYIRYRNRSNSYPVDDKRS